MADKTLTLKSVLTALNDVLRAVRLRDGELLTQDTTERVDYVLSVAKLFAELQGCKDFTEVGPIGFGEQGEDDEEEDDDDEENEDE